MIERRGPGLAKTSEPPLVRRAVRELYATSDARWRALLARADVLSEGATTGDDPQRVYFGTTTLLIAIDARADAGDLLRVAAGNPHLRLRVLRAARREAAQRAGGPLGRVRAEVTMSERDGSLLVRVDVEARVGVERRAEPRPHVLTHASAHTIT